MKLSFVNCKQVDRINFKIMKNWICTICISFISVLTFGQTLKPVDEGSSVKFVIKNFGINTPGSFEGLSGIIQYNAENPVNSEFDVSVKAASIDTDIKARDNHLMKDEYFDVEKFPVLHFKSTKITLTNSAEHLYMFGVITIKGISKEIKFPFTVKSTDGGYLFQGTFTLNRRDFNLGGKSISLSDEVNVDLSILAR